MDIRKITEKIFGLPCFVAIPVALASFILVYFTLSGVLSNPVISYFSYLFSAYGLVVFIIWIIRSLKTSKLYESVMRIVRIFKNEKISLCLSLSINLIYAVLKLIIGCIYKSPWFLSFAIYFLSLFSMRLVILVEKTRKTEEESITICRVIGVMLLVTAGIFSILVALMINDYRMTISNESFVYVMACYSFYAVTSAIIRMMKRRKNTGVNSTAMISISFVTALVSLQSLEGMMITYFGDDNIFKSRMLGITGLVIFILVGLIAFRLIFIRDNVVDKKQMTNE